MNGFANDAVLSTFPSCPAQCEASCFYRTVYHEESFFVYIRSSELFSLDLSIRCTTRGQLYLRTGERSTRSIKRPEWGHLLLLTFIHGENLFLLGFAF